ncbi:hypothetical protein QJS10_CPB04g00250 [Acorus calamus]|uniref:Protein SHOOT GRAVITROPISM 5 n=1 Tax=Acorus calamus TaxID=4465 RepID=A0AAV9F121_ACOCL|nr:hypothetical protein QJS10_CPB04g00250 [Acorus calamus]
MEEQVVAQRELQLLPKSSSPTPGSNSLSQPPSRPPPPLDLQLSISFRPTHPSPECQIEALKRHAEEQMRLAAVEKAYAERVRELTKKETEMAEAEFARARLMWERAREEVERVEWVKEKATRKMSSTCIEITCQACRQRFRL